MNKKLFVKTILFILLYVFLRLDAAQADYLSPAVNLNAAIIQKSFAIIKHNQDTMARTERYEKIEIITLIALAPVKDPKMIEEMIIALEKFCQDDDLAVRIHAQQNLVGLKSSLKMLQRRQKEIDNKTRFLKTIDLAPDFNNARREHMPEDDRFPNLPEIDKALSRLVAEDIERNLVTKTLSYHINAAKNLDVKALIKAIQGQRKLTQDWKIFVVISNINKSYLTEASLVLMRAKDELPCSVIVQPVCMDNEEAKHMVRFREQLAMTKEYPGFFNGTICNLGGAVFTFMEPRPLLTMFWQQMSIGGWIQISTFRLQKMIKDIASKDKLCRYQHNSVEGYYGYIKKTEILPVLADTLSSVSAILTSI